jgi:hypothetical protein
MPGDLFDYIPIEIKFDFKSHTRYQMNFDLITTFNSKTRTFNLCAVMEDNTVTFEDEDGEDDTIVGTVSIHVMYFDENEPEDSKKYLSEILSKLTPGFVMDLESRISERVIDYYIQEDEMEVEFSWDSDFGI